MQDWKVRQQVYHRMVAETSDITPVVLCDGWENNPQAADIVSSYFIQEWDDLVQPYKSFAVAIVYARLLEEHGMATYTDAICDSDLLWNDAHYHPLSPSTVHIYSAVEHFISQHTLWDFEHSSIPQVIATCKYFNAEFIHPL